MQSALSGVKTYLIAALMVGYGITGYLLGELEAADTARWLFEGSGLGALRAGVAKMK